MKYYKVKVLVGHMRLTNMCPFYLDCFEKAQQKDNLLLEWFLLISLIFASGVTTLSSDKSHCELCNRLDTSEHALLRLAVKPYTKSIISEPHSSSLALMDSAFTQKEDFAKPSDVIHKHHDELCNMLDTSEPTLLRFAGKAYSERIIDMPTRLEIERKMGYRGAATLLDIIEWKVKAHPDLIFRVLKIMEELEYLKSIAEDMRDEVYQIEEQRKQHLAIGKFVISCILFPFCFYCFKDDLMNINPKTQEIDNSMN